MSSDSPFFLRALRSIPKVLFTPVMVIGLTIIISTPLFAQWQKVLDNGSPFDCGFAIDSKTILIGSGSGVNGTDLQCNPSLIFKSTDGGSSWYPTKTPAGILGSVTSICMYDALTGYASLFNCPSSPTSALWKTTDGGETWTDLSNAVYGNASSVAATSKAIILTEWIDVGGISTDGGATFSHLFQSANERLSNGIAFSDDNTGVVTMLQHPAFGFTSPFFYTTDAGITWQPSSVQLEAWSVYGKKCSQTFLCASEGELAHPNQTIYISTDGGKTWMNRFTFPDATLSFTGHIAGAANTLYVQTDATANRGLFRSDDLGLSWKSVGGPSAARDTRFVVAGNAGEIAIAFDKLGGVWRTTNGGDATLQSGSNTSGLLSISADSLNFRARSCSPDTLSVRLENFGCSTVTIDSAMVSQTAPVEYDDILIGSKLQIGDSGKIEIHFIPKDRPSHTAKLRIYAHSQTAKFDTTLSLNGIDTSPIHPHFGPRLSANIGETVDVPIYLSATLEPFSLTNLTLSLGFNGDLLTPVSIETHQTLTEGATASFGVSPTQNESEIAITLPAPLTQTNTNFATPLVIVRMGVTLAAATGTDIILKDLSLNFQSPLQLCSPQSVPFQAQLRCGDSTIKSFMAAGSLATILKVVPNPMHNGEEDVSYELLIGGSVTLDLVNANGASLMTLLKDQPQSAGTYYLQFKGRAIASGSYFLRLRLGGVTTSTFKLLQEH